VEKAVAPILAQQRTSVRADGAAQRQAQRLIGVPTETCVEFRYGDLLPNVVPAENYSARTGVFSLKRCAPTVRDQGGR